jgi:hypothetical protein
MHAMFVVNNKVSKNVEEYAASLFFPDITRRNPAIFLAESPFRLYIFPPYSIGIVSVWY